MSDAARLSGLSRESLYKALSGKRSPDFATIRLLTASVRSLAGVVSALGLRLSAGVDESRVA